MLRVVQIVLWCFLVSSVAHAYPWQRQVPLHNERDYILVHKGIYSNVADAKAVAALIQTTLKDIPGDAVIKSDAFTALAPGQYVVASLFDSRQVAVWWSRFSQRNPKVPQGQFIKTRLKHIRLDKVPYFPDANAHQQAFMSEQEAIALVRSIQDVQRLQAQLGRLQFLITDYPRSGDMRYEVEVLKPGGIMYDFFMVDAVQRKVTERYSQMFRSGKTASK